jgi:cyclopropane-fatty-acyl-phospholipid synthase
MSQDTKIRSAEIVGATDHRSEGPSNVATYSSTTERQSAIRGSRGRTQVAEALAPLMNAVLAPQTPVRFEFWDGSGLGPVESSGVVAVRSPQAIRQILWAPRELGLARAYVAGNLDIEGDLYETLRALEDSVQDVRIGIKAMPKLWTGAIRIGVVGRPPSRPSEEARQRGRLHSRSRDSEAVSHHYDVGNEFYRTVLGPSMTYSCARFVNDEATLETAQAAKHDLICRKLGLGERSNMSLLDVGCGWGSMAMHAASQYGAKVVGITLSEQQASMARTRVEDAGLSGRIEIRLQDYRELKGEQFDAISSVGMFEHVGSIRARQYLAILWDLIAPEGRLLNHAISTPGGSKIDSRSFIGRYVFPDGELMDVGQVILDMEKAGFEVRDVESLREHYSKTLHAWVENLQAGWAEAVSTVGEARARVWLLYMAASANAFDDGVLAIHQVLGLKSSPGGSSGMPLTRRDWG